MPSAVRILLTNRSLENFAGSELYVRDVACALAARGHQPVVYSPRLGGVSDLLRARSIPVVRDLARLAEPPDVIHGQHHLQTMAALARFPEVPAIFVCHGWLPWVETPPRFPRILRYVAVDRLRRERLVSEEGISPDRVEIIPNFVDVERFRYRTEPLPSRPRRALVYGNQAQLGTGYSEIVRSACESAGIEVEIAGFGVGRPLARPEEVLPGYDLVFARGRCAIEAMATGVAVILCDHEGLGPLVTGERVEALAGLNFGIGALTREHSVDAVGREIRRFSARDAAAVSAWVREHATLERGVDRLVELYHAVVAEWSAVPPERRHEGSAVATARYLVELEAVLAEHELYREQSSGKRVRAEADAVAAARELAREAQARVRSLETERDALRSDLSVLENALVFRLRAALLRRPWLTAVYRFLTPTGGRSSS